MGVLHGLTRKDLPFRWKEVHQHAFEEVKWEVERFCNHSRVPLDYSDNASPINLVTDASSTRIAGVISQGDDWKNAKVAAFFSAKLNPAQQNYPVHEQELFAGVESMQRHRDILQGVKFHWYTDHQSLIRLLHQKHLSPQQAWWLESLSEFDFGFIYIARTENILCDALSRLYANEAAGTVRAPSEFPQHDDVLPLSAAVGISMPVFVGLEAMAVLMWSQAGAKPVWTPHPIRKYTRLPRSLEQPLDGDVDSRVSVVSVAPSMTPALEEELPSSLEGRDDRINSLQQTSHDDKVDNDRDNVQSSSSESTAVDSATAEGQSAYKSDTESDSAELIQFVASKVHNVDFMNVIKLL